jgi:hypothetical protein
VRVGEVRPGAPLENITMPDIISSHILHATGHNGGLIALRVCVVIKLSINALISRVSAVSGRTSTQPNSPH